MQTVLSENRRPFTGLKTLKFLKHENKGKALGGYYGRDDERDTSTKRISSGHPRIDLPPLLEAAKEAPGYPTPRVTIKPTPARDSGG